MVRARSIDDPFKIHNKMGNWTDEPCYYVSVQDGPKYGLLAGPFRTHQEALALVDVTKQEAFKANDRAVFFAYGTCKAPNGRREGLLNRQVSKQTGKTI
jgi:hypothetical protein